MRDTLFTLSPFGKKQLLLAGVDSLLIFTALFMSYLLRIYFYENVEMVNSMARLSPIIIFFTIIIHLISFYVFELYRIEEGFTKVKGIVTIAFATFTAVIIITIIFYFFPEQKIGRMVLTINIPFVITSIFLWRIVFFNKVVHIKHIHNLLLVGMNTQNEILLKELEKRPIKEYKVVGIIDFEDDVKGSLEPCVKNLPIIRGDVNIRKIVEKEKVDILVLGINTNSSSRLVRDALDLKLAGNAVYDSETFYCKMTRKVPVYHIDKSWLLSSISTEPIFPTFYRNIKRIFDIIFSLTGLILSSPLIPIVAMAIKLTSRGPVFFKQERLGKDERPFILFKFRTMVDNAEEKTGPVWSQKDDARITRLGRFLRKTRIDEVPQFINILKGDMSFVGPRPIRKHFADLLDKEIPFYKLRFSVKPGVTGWDQVNHNYSDSVEEQIEKFQYDLFYIQSNSLILDTIIILKTIQTILFRRGQ